MAKHPVQGIISDADPRPAGFLNCQGSSTFLLTGDHAGNLIPPALAGLGLAPEILSLHIAIDIGVMQLGQLLSETLDAPFVFQRYSRLVIDCNRDPARADAIPAVSDGIAVPGNQTLSSAARKLRVAEILTPYQAAIAALLSWRRSAGQPTALVALHSFTPVMDGVARPWDIGVLYDGGDTRFALALLSGLRRRTDIIVGDNAPYQMDETDYSVPLHAYGQHIPYVEIEVRQDLLATAEGQKRIAAILCETLRMAWHDMRPVIAGGTEA